MSVDVVAATNQVMPHEPSSSLVVLRCFLSSCLMRILWQKQWHHEKGCVGGLFMSHFGIYEECGLRLRGKQQALKTVVCEGSLGCLCSFRSTWPAPPHKDCYRSSGSVLLLMVKNPA